METPSDNYMYLYRRRVRLCTWCGGDVNSAERQERVVSKMAVQLCHQNTERRYLLILTFFHVDRPILLQFWENRPPLYCPAWIIWRGRDNGFVKIDELETFFTNVVWRQVSIRKLSICQPWNIVVYENKSQTKKNWSLRHDQCGDSRPWQKKRALKFALKGSENYKACFEL